MNRQYYVYILASKPRGTLYIAVTNSVARRVWQHRQGLIEGFTKRYGVHRLVYCETYARPQDAVTREKRLKKWNRMWKIRLIETANPRWDDLYDTVMEMPRVAQTLIPKCLRSAKLEGIERGQAAMVYRFRPRARRREAQTSNGDVCATPAASYRMQEVERWERKLSSMPTRT